MPIEITVGKKTYESTKHNHAEEIMFNSGRYEAGDFTAEMDGWPCTGEHKGHNCHALFTRQSAGRTITLIVNDDHAGYAKNHDFDFDTIGKIIYSNGKIEYKDTKKKEKKK